MAKRKSPPREKPVEQQAVNIQQTITQSVVAWDDVAFAKLLETQAMALGELTSIKTLLDLSKEVKRAETPAAPAAAPVDYGKIQQEMLRVAKDQLKASRRTYKLQEDFQKEWDKEAKNIAEMAKGMKTFKTLGEKMADTKQGLKEKFGSAGGLKKTVLGALNVGGVFNKTLERDKFVEQQRALGSTASTKDLKKDYEGAQAAAKATKKTEAQIEKMKAAAANGGAEVSEEKLKSANPEFAKLLEKRQSNADEFGKYQRATDIYSPTPVNRNLVPAAGAAVMTDAQRAKGLAKKAAAGMSNLVPTPTAPELGKTPTATAAEATQGAEEAAENMKMQQQELDLLQKIADNIGGDKKDGQKKPEEAKASGGGFLDTIFSMLGTGLMTAFKALLNPMNILKALGKVFAIGMIIGALFEGVMDGFDEFMKTGDIGKALIAGLAGIIDFLTFGLFDKEKIKEVIGDFSKWIGDHLIKPFTDFISSMKDSFMSLIENIGLPEIKFKIPIVGKEVSIGPFYPFKSDAKPSPAAPTAAAPTTANQVESQSAENAGAKEAPAASNSTNVVNAPSTTNNNTTQVQLRPPIRNEESSNSRYAASRYA
jgi:hypothetical protein